MRRIRDFLFGVLLVLLFTLFDKSLEDGMDRSARSFVRGWAVTALVLALLVIICSCSIPQKREIIARRSANPTVLVVNETIEQMAVYASNTRIGTIESGRSACLRLPMMQSDFRLFARPLGGGRVRYSPPLSARTSWKWTISAALSSDGIALGLLDSEPCK